jgi:hypothetical protein
MLNRPLVFIRSISVERRQKVEGKRQKAEGIYPYSYSYSFSILSKVRVGERLKVFLGQKAGGRRL